METLSVTKKSHKDTIDSLKEYGEQNTLFYMVCKKFSERVRNRDHITAPALKLAMGKDGLNFPLTKYCEILEFLGKQGLGRVTLDKAQRVVELTRIPVSLQSIGQIVVTSAKPAETEIIVEPIAEHTPQALNESKTLKYTTMLTVIIKGNPVVFPGPDTDDQDLGNLLLAFAKLSARK